MSTVIQAGAHKLEVRREAPFCGGIKMDWEDADDLYFEEVRESGRKLRCANCDAETGWHRSTQETVAAWNRRASDWISVEERLPEEGVPVLLLTASCHPELDDGPPIKLGEREGDGWLHQVEANGYMTELYLDVTHWMPLPELPK